MIGLKDQCFGVEVEMTGITREQAATALAAYFATDARYVGGAYDKWCVTDRDGKEWTVMSDSSIHGEQKIGSGYRATGDYRYRVEMVTPKLTYAELPKLQECVRQVRHAGAKANSSCGIHVHVDAANHNRQSLKNLIGIMYSKEDILFKALQVNESRASRWCQKVALAFGLIRLQPLEAVPERGILRFQLFPPGTQVGNLLFQSLDSVL